MRITPKAARRRLPPAPNAGLSSRLTPAGRRSRGNHQSPGRSAGAAGSALLAPTGGDDPSRDWSEISEELRRIRGIYGTKEGAEAALMDHIGMQTR